MQTVIYDRWYLAEQERQHRLRQRDIAPPAGRVLDRREACPRRALAAAQAADGASFAALSRMIGRPDHYLARFVRDGHPAALTADEHRYLSLFFGLDERGLGVRDLWAEPGRALIADGRR